MNDLFQPNDWDIKRLLVFNTGVQITWWLGFWLGTSTSMFSVLQQFVSLIYLLYLPGILILKIMKIHKLGTIKTILFSVGLSIAAVMFIGLLMNGVYPSFGIAKPISPLPLSVTFSAVMLILSGLAYIRDRDFTGNDPKNFSEFFSPTAFFLYFLPILSAVGTFLVNNYQLNTLLLFLIILIGAFVVFTGSGEITTTKLYPLAIFSISLSLLLHYTLISKYILGSDIHEEYQFAQLVIDQGYWNSHLPGVYNAMLSIAMLTPVIPPPVTPNQTQNTTPPVTPNQTQNTTPPVVAYTVNVASTTLLGQYLVDSRGRTLYYTISDRPNFSNLPDETLTSWPVFYTANFTVPPSLNAADFGTYTRDNKVKQTTYKGYPLYFFYLDRTAGDAIGNKLGNTWFIVVP